MKKNYYVTGVLVIIIVVLLVVILSGRKEATAPSTAPEQTSQASPSSGQANPAPNSVGMHFPIHAIRAGVASYYYPETLGTSTIVVNNPPTNTTVTSPIAVSGQARSWFFENVAPVLLTDASGRIIATATLKSDDWTSEQITPFVGSLSFPRQPTGSKGVVVVRNDNPSGLASADKWVEIVVTFK